MAGLLYKDWLLLRRQLWYYALLLGLYLALTAAGVLDASFLCGLAVLYGTLLPTTCFSYDEAVHWERYAAATPAGRRGTVDGKYLLALLLAALSGGISLFLTALMEGPESALSLAVLVCTGLALAVNAVNPSPAVGGEPQPGSPLLCVHPLLRRRHGSAFALPAGPSSPAHPRPGRRPALAGDRPVRGGLRRLLVHRAEDLL